MSRVVSVDKTLLSSGVTTWFVTLEDSSGERTRVEVDEAGAQRFKRALTSQQDNGGTRLLTETIP